MIAKSTLPDEFRRFNDRYMAPYGRLGGAYGSYGLARYARRIRSDRAVKFLGPYSFQPNSPTRRFEYPWVANQIQPQVGLRVLEIGGALSGLQFTLSGLGCEVHNVDPFYDYGSGAYKIDPVHEIARLNHAFGTNVVLHQMSLPELVAQDLHSCTHDASGDARLGTFDVVYSVSTLKHIPKDDLQRALACIPSLLKDSGRVVLTVDLFTNIYPFTTALSNQWGTNVSLKWIGEVLEMEMESEAPGECFGFEEFSTDAITSNLGHYSYNRGGPQLAQCISYRKSKGNR